MASREPADTARRQEGAGPSVAQFIIVIGIIAVVAVLALLVMGGQVSQTFGGVGDSV